MTTRNLLLDWLAKPTEQILLQIPRALVVSGLAALLDLGLFVLLFELWGWHAIPAATVSYLVGGVLQYVLCVVWVFPAAPEKATTGFIAFTLLSLPGLAITWGTMIVLCDWMYVNEVVAKVAALGLAFCWNFLSRKYLLFKDDGVE